MYRDNYVYIICADAISSQYTFSVYDDTVFDGNLLLSGGREHTQMWGAETCFQGTATYNVNILKVREYVLEWSVKEKTT